MSLCGFDLYLSMSLIPSIVLNITSINAMNIPFSCQKIKMRYVSNGRAIFCMSKIKYNDASISDQNSFPECLPVPQNFVAIHNPILSVVLRLDYHDLGFQFRHCSNMLFVWKKEAELRSCNALTAELFI